MYMTLLLSFAFFLLYYFLLLESSYQMRKSRSFSCKSSYDVACNSRDRDDLGDKSRLMALVVRTPQDFCSERWHFPQLRLHILYIIKQNHSPVYQSTKK